MSDFFIDIIDDDDDDSRDDSQGSTVVDSRSCWKVAIVDDEESIHQVTKLALSSMSILGRNIEFLSAYSAREGFELLSNNPDIAVVLLDVVMENPEAGLQLARRIRQELGNHNTQIILRTGQPGYAPEEVVITEYEINDYKTKSELTRTKLFSTIYTSLRTYQHLVAMEQSKIGLQKIIDSSANLFQERSIKEFSEGALLQINALFSIQSEGIFCISSGPLNGDRDMIIAPLEAEQHRIVAATNIFKEYFGKAIDDLEDLTTKQTLHRALSTKEHQFTNKYICLFLNTPSQWEGAIFIKGDIDEEKLDHELLSVFAMNVSLGLENTKFFTQLTQMAYYDMLTQFFTRHGIIDRCLNAAVKNRKPFSVCILDIDYFHEVTESLGFDYGNKVLVGFAKKIQSIFPIDSVFARLHSDVFAVVVFGERHQDIERIAKQCAEAIEIDGDKLRFGVSVGESEFLPDDKQTGEELLRQAEIALKLAKEVRRGGGQSFTPSLATESRSRIQLLGELREALAHRKLVMYLQPKVSLEKNIEGQIVGFEALIRWPHDTKGMIPPNDFVPVAERSGLYYELDMYVVEECCKILANHHELTRIAFNLSANSLNRPELVDDLENLLAKYGVTHDAIVMEITENSMAKGGIVIDTLERLQAKGWMIHLDDFGTGYSSLSYLLDMPLHAIKIDRSFLLQLHESNNAEVLLKGIISICKDLDKKVIVEGVETTSQKEFALAAGADIAQGYLFYKPLSLDDALKLLPSDKVQDA